MRRRWTAATRVLIVRDVPRDDAEQVAAAYRELFLAAGGGALGLFTAIGRLRDLKQAYGRLIRRADDRGVFVMLGSRLPSRLLSAFPAGVSIERPGLAKLRVVVKNFRFLAGLWLTGWKKSMTMMLAARENPMFSGNSHWRARDRGESRSTARPIAAHLNSTALLTKIDAAIATIPASARIRAGGL